MLQINEKSNLEDQKMTCMKQDNSIYQGDSGLVLPAAPIEIENVALTKKIIPLEQGSPLLSKTKEPDYDSEDETLCGLGSWKPPLLQRFASKKSYVLIHGLTGMCMTCIVSYLIATISTLEKRFKIPSRTSGLIASAWDVGAVFSVIGLTYLGSLGHKTRWVAGGTYLVALSCFTGILPHLIYGPGQDAIELTYEFTTNSTNISLIKEKPVHVPPLCSSSESVEDCLEGSGSFNIPAIILFTGQFIMGIAGSTYFTLGMAYLDDNTKKDKAPVTLAAAQFLRMFGPTIGYLIASYTLTVYVSPSLHPIIDKDDPRWIGAWWMGWAPMGMTACFFATILMLFPQQLPRTAQRKKVRQIKLHRKSSLKDFIVTCQRLFRNKIFLLNTFSTVFFMFGFVGYWAFMPKYMETQYRQSAAKASLITGSVGLIFSALGLMLSAVVISKFKPRPRVLATWNVIVECMDVIGHFSWAFLSCTNENLHGDWAPDKTWNLTAECNMGCFCGPSVKYAPVCSADGTTTFYSACHAGCTTSETIGEITRYSNCTCVNGGFAVEGSCPVDCGSNFTIFLTIQCIMRFLGASGRAGNTLIQFRCVDEDDKSLSIAFIEVLMAVLAYIPGPIIYGLLIDHACLVWGQTCGQIGNCWLYDAQTVRYLLNFTAAVFLTGGTLLDIGVWYHCKDLQIYDHKEDPKKEEELSNVGTQDDYNFEPHEP